MYISFFYPLDFRISGKDVTTNRLSNSYKADDIDKAFDKYAVTDDENDGGPSSPDNGNYECLTMVAIGYLAL